MRRYVLPIILLCFSLSLTYPYGIIPEDYVIVPMPDFSQKPSDEYDICIVDDFSNDRLAEEILNSDLDNTEVFPFHK